MTHPSKVKGNSFERSLVNEAKDAGLDAERAYASNGLSLGYTEDVDCLVAGKKIQAKRRKVVAKWLIPSDTVDAVATRPDRGETLIVMRYSDFLEMLKDELPCS
jgi:Holliday junction resolvase